MIFAAFALAWVAPLPAFQPPPTTPAPPPAKLTFEDFEGGEDPAAGDSNAPLPLVQVLIRRSARPEAGQMMSGGPNGTTAVNRSAEDLLTSVLGVSGIYLDRRTALPAGTFDLIARFPPDAPREDRDAAVRIAVVAALGVRVRTEKRTVKALVLRVPEGGEATLTPADPDPRAGTSLYFYPGDASQRIEMTKASAGTLAGALRRSFGRPVLNETGLTGSYDLTLQWYGRPARDEPGALREAVAEQTGLTLTEEDRELEFTVIEARE